MKETGANLVDLTHTLSAETPCWDGDCGFNLAIECDYSHCSGPDLFRTQKITTRAGMGTHMDAPAHCFPGAKTIDALRLEDLITECVVINVSEQANEHYLVMPDVIEKFETKHGKIPPNAFVLFHTGWGRLWNTPERYRNNLQFPSVHEHTAKLLLERTIAGIGIDTLSADAQGKAYPVHRAILGAGKYLVENVANAEALPPRGAKIFVLPVKIKEGTEAPVRMVAVV